MLQSLLAPSSLLFLSNPLNLPAALLLLIWRTAGHALLLPVPLRLICCPPIAPPHSSVPPLPPLRPRRPAYLSRARMHPPPQSLPSSHLATVSRTATLPQLRAGATPAQRSFRIKSRGVCKQRVTDQQKAGQHAWAGRQAAQALNRHQNRGYKQGTGKWVPRAKANQAAGTALQDTAQTTANE